MKQILEQALEALKSSQYQLPILGRTRAKNDAAIASIESALAAPAQEPVKPLPGADWTVTMREMQDRAEKLKEQS